MQRIVLCHPAHITKMDQPGKIWVTDITNIKTHAGCLSLPGVIDLFSWRALAGKRRAHETQ